MTNRAAPFPNIFPPTPAVTVPIAAYAAGVTPRTFRGWLESRAVRMLVPRRAAGAWLRCAPADVVRLAVVGHLVRFGFTLAEAASLVVAHVDRHIEGVILATGDCPWRELDRAFRAVCLTVSRESGGTAVSVHTLFGSHSVKHTSAVLSIHLGWISAEVRKRVRERTGAAE